LPSFLFSILDHTVSKLYSLRRALAKPQAFFGLSSVLLRWSFTIQSCSPSRLHQGATAFGLSALLLACLGGRDC